MTCPECPHEAHFPGPCAGCATLNTTCIQGVTPTGVHYDERKNTVEARGQIEMATGVEERPCCLCRSFEMDRPKLIRHLLRHKLTPNEDGTFTTPIVKDFPGRKSMVIDPKTYGWCRRDTIPVDMLATCAAFRPVRTSSELESRIKS